MPIMVPDRDDWFPKSATLPCPDWPAIGTWMCDNVTPEYADEAAGQITRYWLVRLVAALGDTHTLAASEHFLLVAVGDEKRRTQTLDFLEKSRAFVLAGLGDVAPEYGLRPQVFLRLGSVDACDEFLASFDSDGAYTEAASTFFPNGSAPLPYCECTKFSEESGLLAGHIASHLLRCLPLPRWLQHGAALVFKVALVGGHFGVLYEDLVREHERCWTTETIQDFWSGKALEDERWQSLSCSLAEILIDVIQREVRPDPDTFRQFVAAATFQDGGEAAAHEHLGVGLGEIASVFLGDGDWTPQPSKWDKCEEPA
ncbi:MAG: hypothetical protein ABJF10_18690 [Chthoniobacter sp.]|uniref:hypothetical protein n=1 Tax=Chthoniobacter sp. TaxID=2510640 RepID=UPI0032A5478C